MTSSVIAITLLVLFGFGFNCSSASAAPSQSPSESVKPFNPTKMPVRIDNAKLESSVEASWLDYSLTNVSGEEIHAIHFRIFIGDSVGRVTKTKDGFSRESITPGTTQRGRVLIKGTLKRHAIAMVAITRVIGDSGVWWVDDSTLATAIQSQLVHQPEPSVAVTFEPNAATTENDRRQIFELVVTEILQDEKKAERLLNRSRVVFLRDGVTFDLPRPLRTNLIALDRNEIQRIAEREERVVFLNYEPLTSEGSRILATISLRDAVSRGSRLRVPYKFTFVFWCVRQNGQWVIEKSVGYAQS